MKNVVIMEKKMGCSSIKMEENLIIRSGEEAATLTFKILPVEDKQGFWINTSSDITVAIKHYDDIQNERVINVRGVNNGNTPIDGRITVVLDNGVKEECQVTILPEMSMPPRFVKTPEVVFADGRAIIDYELSELGDNDDQSEISWYRMDNKDRSNFEVIHLSKKSNETDSRKVAVSRWDKPCREIRLTSADIGKHIKVNIKPKHSNSEKGQGLNIISRIVKPTDVNQDIIILNPQTMVTSNDYDMEPGYFTVRGTIESDYCFGTPRRPGLVTESMGCGIYYMKENPINDMSLIALVEPQCNTGNGFSGPHQYADIYIKYDPETQNGYALRIEGTAADDGKVVFCLYQMKNGNSTPVSDEFLSDAFKPGCEINLQVRDDILNAFISYDDGEDFSDVEIRAKIRPNDFGGFGFKYMAEPEDGYKCCLKYMEATFNNDIYG